MKLPVDGMRRGLGKSSLDSTGRDRKFLEGILGSHLHNRKIWRWRMSQMQDLHFLGFAKVPGGAG